MPKVSRFLGRPFSLSGRVAHGTKRGKQLDFPTANLEVNSEQALPADGVYVTRAYLSNHTYPSVTNIGRRPTFGQGERIVEVHILDFERELYGEGLAVELVQRLRGEQKFSSAKELNEQIRRDVKQARRILS